MDFSSCEWDTAQYFIFSDNVFGNLVYYTHLLPILISLPLSLYILIKNFKAIPARILFLITVWFSLWSFFDLILWATEKPHYTMFFWSLLSFLEPLIYISCLYLVYQLSLKKYPSFGKNVFLFLLMLPIIFFASTSYNLFGFDFTNCDREAIEGSLWAYTYLFEIVIVIWILTVGTYAIIKNKGTQRKIALFSTIGAVLFLILFSLGNIIGTLEVDWEIGQYGLFGMPIFAAFVAYITVRFNSFNVKILSAQILVFALGLLVTGVMLVRTIENVRVIASATLIFVFLLGIYLIRGVRKEVAQREEIEKLASELKVANAHLEELSMQKSQFVSLATHQIRSPLTALKGYASLILDGDYGQISKEQKDAITAMYESAHNLITIVGDYLDISRIDLGKMKYDMTEFSLRDLVAATVHDLLPNIRTDDKKLTFAPKNPDDPCPIRADMGKIKQIVGNIIDNSIKYTPKGTITVSVEHKVATRRYLISVVDTGVGVTPETKAHLFKRFSRADDAHTVNTQGTGLGLFIVKQFVEAHGGRIWVESEGKDKGSQFYVELPERAEDVK